MSLLYDMLHATPKQNLVKEARSLRNYFGLSLRLLLPILLTFITYYLFVLHKSYHHSFTSNRNTCFFILVSQQRYIIKVNPLVIIEVSSVLKCFPYKDTS